MKTTETCWKGEAALELETDGLRLVAPTEFGPRILYFGDESNGNWLLEIPTDPAAPADQFQLRGGHRLWHAPEDPVRTYQPDNDPVERDALPGGGFLLRQAVEPATGMAKEISVSPAGKRTVRIDHRLANRGLWTVTCAPWALTVLRPGGTAVMPFPARGEHPRDLLPGHRLVPWSYADFSLPCWKFHRTWLGLTTACATPQKIGQGGHPGWLAYVRGGAAFVKASRPRPRSLYPDLGCQAELFTDGLMLELETLGPLVDLAPGDVSTHREYWTLFGKVPDEEIIGEADGLRERIETWAAELVWN